VPPAGGILSTLPPKPVAAPAAAPAPAPVPGTPPNQR
jgi:hypothetical protein